MTWHSWCRASGPPVSRTGHAIKIRRTGVVGGVYVFVGLDGALAMELLERHDGIVLVCWVVCLNWSRREAKPDMVRSVEVLVG